MKNIKTVVSNILVVSCFVLSMEAQALPSVQTTGSLISSRLDVAPDAELYLAKIGSGLQLEEAFSDMIAAEVPVFNIVDSVILQRIVSEEPVASTPEPGHGDVYLGSLADGVLDLSDLTRVKQQILR